MNLYEYTNDLPAQNTYFPKGFPKKSWSLSGLTVSLFKDQFVIKTNKLTPGIRTYKVEPERVPTPSAIRNFMK